MEGLASTQNRVEEQRIAELQQDPPAPPLPAGASHWDRLSAELRLMIIEASGPLTKLAVGTMTPDQLEAASREEQQQAWKDAFATDWQGDLRLLPPRGLTNELPRLIRTRSMHARVSGFDTSSLVSGLTMSAIAHEWSDLVDRSCMDIVLAMNAAAAGGLWLLRELIDERRTVELNKGIAIVAAAHGQLSVIQFLHERMPDGSWDQLVVSAAIHNGHVDCIEWLLANRSERCSPDELDVSILGSQPDAWIRNIVERGWMRVTKKAVDNAAKTRSVSLMQFLCSEGGDELFTSDAMDEAANNSVAMLEWLHGEFELVPTTQALKNAAIGDKVDVASWLLETFPDVQWDLSAAYHLSHDCKTNPRCAAIFLEWASQHGIEIGPK
ncbi:hypothetical protein HK105_203421 [Polyrhizophydium stewartii]|uniref:Ankyrin repeat protein n=1 Tax=Polyrhizophydium stewartii TaxID=2732419 RepID=A0ABR4NBR6_9FUNG